MKRPVIRFLGLSLAALAYLGTAGPGVAHADQRSVAQSAPQRQAKPMHATKIAAATAFAQTEPVPAAQNPPLTAQPAQKPLGDPTGATSARPPAAAEGTSVAPVPPDLAARAASAYDRGDFAAAAATYEQAVQAGIVNGHLYYNLGLVYFRQGRRGDAVAALLAARRFLPRDPDVAANLRFVLADVHDKLEPERPTGTAGISSLYGWLDHVTARELVAAASATAAACGLALLAAVLLPGLATRAWPRRAALAAFFIPLLFAAGFGLKRGDADAWGAVCDTAAKVYSGPGKLNPVVFELREGAPVLVTESVPGGFYRIELSDGKRGWIPDSDVRVFGPL